MRNTSVLLLLSVSCCWAQTTESLRGVSAVSGRVLWGSGAAGTWLRSLDGGKHWAAAKVPGAEGLDFRGIHAASAGMAWLMSAGPGDKSRVYRTVDGGANWVLQFTNPDENGFFDALAFRDTRHGIIAGDAVDGMMTIFTTDDGGGHWTRRKTPPALPGEGAFAASNSCLTVLGRKAWFGTSAGRVLYSEDGGLDWVAAQTPIRHDAASAGVFSVAFADSRHGIAVGGDYAKDTEARDNIAFTQDGGVTWRAPAGDGPKGFRSAVVHLKGDVWLVTGTSGSDVSIDGGKAWRTFDTRSFHALAGSLAVGAQGQVARLNYLPTR